MTQDANQELDQELETEEVQLPETTNEADSSPDSADKHEEKTSGVQERINQITREKWEERRKREELEKRLAELESGNPQKEHQAPTSEIKAPELPSDLFDEEAMRKYHADMVTYQNQLAQYSVKSFYESQQEQAQQKQATEQQQTKLRQYAENAQKAGVDLDKLANAEKVLNQYRLDPQLANYLMTDKAGPQVITYLADNPAELNDLLSTDPMTAAIKIATEVKAKALSTTPKVSKAPDPQPDIGGGGALEVDDFERKYGKPEFI